MRSKPFSPPDSEMSARTLRQHARDIFNAALAAADPSRAVEGHLARIDFDRFQKIYVVGAGKAGRLPWRRLQLRHARLSGTAASGFVRDWFNVKYGYTRAVCAAVLN